MSIHSLEYGKKMLVNVQLNVLPVCGGNVAKRWKDERMKVIPCFLIKGMLSRTMLWIQAKLEDGIPDIR